MDLEQELSSLDGVRVSFRKLIDRSKGHRCLYPINVQGSPSGHSIIMPLIIIPPNLFCCLIVVRGND